MFGLLGLAAAIAVTVVVVVYRGGGRGGGGVFDGDGGTTIRYHYSRCGQTENFGWTEVKDRRCCTLCCQFMVEAEVCYRQVSMHGHCRTLT